MMRTQFVKQLEELNTKLVHMAALCEEIIACAVKSLLEDDIFMSTRANSLEKEINLLSQEIEKSCVYLVLHQQPVAGDLRNVTAIQNIIIDLRRISNQCAGIAELADDLKECTIRHDYHLHKMAVVTIGMLTNSIESYINRDLNLVTTVITTDDELDQLFLQIKNDLVLLLYQDSSLAEDCLNLLMIAKYLERIGDHAVTIGQWVAYIVTGERLENDILTGR